MTEEAIDYTPRSTDDRPGFDMEQVEEPGQLSAADTARLHKVATRLRSSCNLSRMWI